MKEFPVNVDQWYTVHFPIGGARQVKCTVPGDRGFLGENENGKPVKVRSYKMVEGLKDFQYVPPVKEEKENPFVVGQVYRVRFPRAIVSVKCEKIVGEGFEGSTDSGAWRKVRFAKMVVDESAVLPVKEKPVKPKSGQRRKLELVRNGKTYLVDWNDDNQFWITDVDGNHVFKANAAKEILEVFRHEL